MTEDIYSKKAKILPERDVAGIDDKINVKRDSLEEREEASPNETDMQTATKKLFPSDLGDREANAMMVARIAPDVFLDLLYLMTVSDIQQVPPGERIDVVGTLAKNYALASIGLDGKGRIDQIELAGASKDIEELEKLGKGLF